MSATSSAFRWGWELVDARGPSAAGHRAAERALAQFGTGLCLAHEGTRPIVAGTRGMEISISHGRRVAVAVVGPVATLGVDLCEHKQGPRVRTMAARFLTRHEQTLFGTDSAAATVWAAKEAGLKTLGMGLYNAGFFDDPERCPVEVASVEQPRFASPSGLVLEVEDFDHMAIALAYSDQTAPSTTTVAPFM